MRKACFGVFLAIITITQYSFAQPGGGGGVRIQVILDKNNKPIPAGDSNLVIKTFLLSGEESPVITREYTDRDRDRSYRYIGRENTRYYVPPYLWGTDGKTRTPNQCLEFIYKGDTTVVELLGISTGSGNGSAEQMDTVKLWPAYYSRFYRTASKRFADVRQWERKKAVDESDKAYRLMCRGITDSTAQPLYHYDLLEQRYPVKQIVYDKGSHYDTFPAYRTPLYTLPLKNIGYRKDSSITITTSDIPLIDNKQQLYRFVLNYTPSELQEYSGEGKSKNENAMLLNIKLGSIIRSFRSHPLLVNGKAYTGILKLFHTSLPIGFDRDSHGYGLDVMRYKNGKLAEIHSAGDVDTEDERPHPRLTRE